MPRELTKISEPGFCPTVSDLEILHRVQALSPPPEVALQVIELARNPDVDLAVLAAHIERDPALVARLLRTVNSAQFGLSYHVNSVSQAISLLGLKSLRLLVTAFGMAGSFSASVPKALYELYWKKSLTIALVMRELADRVAEDGCVAFTCGLLSDIGVLALAQVSGEVYHSTYENLWERPRDLLEEERALFETDHCRIGALVLGEYGLDSQIVSAVLQLAELDSDSGPAPSSLEQQLSMAHSLGTLWCRRDREEWTRIWDRLREEFGVDTDGFLDLVTRVRGELHQWGRLFELDVPTIDESQFRAKVGEALAALSVDSAIELSMFECVFGHNGGFSGGRNSPR